MLITEKQHFNVFPKQANIFKALEETNPNDIKAVIIGQDPYPTAGQAIGVAFASDTMTASLDKIEEALRLLLSDSKFILRPSMTEFRSKVLLLNSALTVREGKTNAHYSFWQPFMVELIKTITELCPDVPLFLWGTQALKLFEVALKKHKLNSTTVHISEHPAFAARRGKAFVINGGDKLIKIVYGKKACR